MDNAQIDQPDARPSTFINSGVIAGIVNSPVGGF
jgi:hypothetical protein